jgi:aminomethyltransferase
VVAGGGLLALQGPTAVDVMARLCPDVDFAQIAFMSGHKMSLDGRECFVTRSGYTGEDGFEISVGAGDAESLASQLLEQPEVLPVGLGARDSLRLEAGLCLYGNDIDDTTTPAEAVLMWTVGKRRREEGGFPGHEIIMKQFKEKSAARKRVGFMCEPGAGAKKARPARGGSRVLNAEGEQVGVVTSGVQSPCLGKPLGMAYVQSQYQKAGNELLVDVGGKVQPLIVTRMPFTEAGYYRGPE